MHHMAIVLPPMSSAGQQVMAWSHDLPSLLWGGHLTSWHSPLPQKSCHWHFWKQEACTGVSLQQQFSGAELC